MSNYTARLLAIGNELTAGKIVDSNSAFLARELAHRDIEVRSVTVLRDRQPEIEAALRSASTSADLVFTTGGLGPTSDDLTRIAIAAVAGTPLEENADARRKLEELFAARKRPMNENNLRQVQFPRDAEVILNRVGTADAFVTRLTADGRTVPVVSLPGVPSELKIIFEEQLSPWLEMNFPTADGAAPAFSWRCFGRSESFLGRQIEGCKLPPEIDVAYRPMFPEVLLSFTHRGEGDRNSKQEELASIQPKLTEAIGADFIFSREEGRTLPAAVLALLQEKNLRFSAAESCSGGLIAHLMASLDGASECFLASAVTYSNEAKSVFLGVRPAVLKRYGAVSRETAIEMARGAKYRTGADLAVSVTGIAGPTGGSPEKPVGTFFLGLAYNGQEDAWPYYFPHERNMMRAYTAHLALDLTRRAVLGLPLQWDRV